MKKISIKHSNTDIRKLHNLAYNGVLDKRTVKRIIENSTFDEIVFNSSYTYEIFKKFEFSNLAMYN